MAFWAIGKVKGLSSNLIDVGSKLKSYVSTNASSQFEIQIDSKNSIQKGVNAGNTNISDQKAKKLRRQDKNYTQEELLQIQAKQYQKLTRIQQQIMRVYKLEEQSKLQEKNRILNEQLKAMLDEQQQLKKDSVKNSIIFQIESGKKSVQELIQENLYLREQIQSSKVHRSQLSKNEQ